MCEECDKLTKQLSDNLDRANAEKQKPGDIAERQTLVNARDVLRKKHEKEAAKAAKKEAKK